MGSGVITGGSGGPVYGNATVINGQRTVTAAGTAEALGGVSRVAGVWVKPLSSNTGDVFIGDENVDATNGFILSPTDGAVYIPIGSLANLFIDAANNDDGVSFLAA